MDENIDVLINYENTFVDFCYAISLEIKLNWKSEKINDELTFRN